MSALADRAIILQPLPPGKRPRGWPRSAPSKRVPPAVAKTSPAQFVAQVRAETAKVVWPTRRETVMTGIMVVIMTTILALFFLGVDSFFNAVVQALLKFAR